MFKKENKKPLDNGPCDLAKMQAAFYSASNLHCV